MHYTLIAFARRLGKIFVSYQVSCTVQARSSVRQGIWLLKLVSSVKVADNKCNKCKCNEHQTYDENDYYITRIYVLACSRRTSKNSCYKEKAIALVSSKTFEPF